MAHIYLDARTKMFMVSCQFLEQVTQTDCEISTLRDFQKLDEEGPKHTTPMLEVTLSRGRWTMWTSEIPFLLNYFPLT